MKLLIVPLFALLAACQHPLETGLSARNLGDRPKALFPVESPLPAGSVVFALRHAEAGTQGRDPSLTAVGQARAIALGQLLSAAGVTHLANSGLARTSETLEHLARAQKLSPTVIPPGETDALVDWIVRAGPQAVACVAGHSNTIPALLEALGADVSGIALHEPSGERRFAHDRHERLFCVVGLGEGQVRSFELTVGAVALESAAKAGEEATGETRE